MHLSRFQHEIEAMGAKMFLALKRWGGRRAGLGQPGPAMVAAPGRTGSERLHPVDCPLSSLDVTSPISPLAAFGQAYRPKDQARALLIWLQSPGGRCGKIDASDMPDILSSMCTELGVEPCSWVAVARAFRELIGATKEYEWRGGKRRVIYFVPTSAASIRPLRPALELVA